MLKILLVNPPIYDFAAYDFWLKPYGLLSVAGFLHGKAQMQLFDYLDREHPFVRRQENLRFDKWGRGRFYLEKIPNPEVLKNIPRHFRRFGLPRKFFHDFLKTKGPFDLVMIQTMMTYWYPGIKEVIEDIREYFPDAGIIAGGNYATLCPEHAGLLGIDLIVKGTSLDPLWSYLGVEPDLNQPALWESYDHLKTGAIKLSDGCPFNCTYCSVPEVYGKFKKRPLNRCLEELKRLEKSGVSNLAFYDDALLFDAEKILVPFLKEKIKLNINVNLHSPNALNARFLKKDLAQLMVGAGFKTFYLGFESSSRQWQKKTGSKVNSEELEQAVMHLKNAGADPSDITAYQIIGHPDSDIQQLEETMVFVHSLGIRGMLADFSPIPGTPDGDACSKWVDMSEPLMHNKTAFPVILLGFEETNRLKDLQRKLNRSLNA